MDNAPRHYLLIGNETLNSPAVYAWIDRAIAAGACCFTVVVPATPVRRRFTWTEGEAIAAARERLESVLSTLRARGADVANGVVGDADPVEAALDALRTHRADAVVISTFPRGVSKWLRMDAVARLRRSVDVPVIHLTAVSELVAA